MYVDDVDDLDELEFLRDEAVERLDSNPDNEQAQFDLEDINERISEVVAANEDGREFTG
ncbi:hypothetical protein SEA_DARTHPHADER_74 [Mycobacterium phage DarthPhader]|uniref:Uncharacterized protein n=1 Tax=Mycobacterium phage DarthPhader TaxID=1912975 RepID=A0A1I9S420_9CAUD|nr:hypothetical protein KIV60_gp27 [Mycobacterium phage DarthPhader]AOZ61314.1 hypothetical protein SEA_DARTHPHADER_74 [Mycobacterium phage DarthPhader]